MRNQSLCKLLLVFTDLITAICSCLTAIFLLQWYTSDLERFLPSEQRQEYLIIHLTLNLFGIVWFWIRLRHYTYRKPFWFELKEIIRTLLILAVIDLAIIAFSKLYFSRYLWALTWGITLICVPIGRVYMKKWLIKSKLYLKNTIIIGGKNNSIDAYKALISEPYLGFKIKYFISETPLESLKELGIPIINETRRGIWQLVTKKEYQYILALEENESDLRDQWLRFFFKKSLSFRISNSDAERITSI
ncbi:MAG: hypothetical protein Q4C75_07325 [Bergeyella zoohelcum]|nr:hypothetical protein [Bergeyella zoohelcum]